MNNKIPAVEKTIQMLLTLSGKEATQSELSKTLGISMSTTYRILMTLLEHRWISKSEGGVYTLSDGILPLVFGFSQEVNILEKTAEKVKKLSEKYQIACKISVRKENLQMTCFRAEPRGPVALTGQTGSTFPLIEGSVGAVLLAGETDDAIEKLVEECDAEIPEKQDPTLLYDAIREVREHGVVFNLRKNRWNIAACSAPVYDLSGKIIAAVTLIGVLEDFAGKNQKKWITVLEKTLTNKGADYEH